MARVLLTDVPFSGANGSTTFTDATGNLTWLPLGDAQIQGNALSLDGSGDGVYAASHNAWFRQFDFSIAFEMKQPPGSSHKILIELLNIASPQWLWQVHTSNGILRWVANSSTGSNIQVLTSPSRLDDDTWKAIKLERIAGTLKLYVDSVEVASATDLRDYGNDATLTFGIRTGVSPAYGYTGLFRNLQIEGEEPPPPPVASKIAAWIKKSAVGWNRGVTRSFIRRFGVHNWPEPVKPKSVARVYVTRGVPPWWGPSNSTTQLPTYKLRGRVMQRDPDGVLPDEPVVNARVALYFRRLHTLIDIQRSDENGYVQFDNLMPGTQAYYAIAFDPEGAPLQNSVLWDRLSSEPGP